MPLLAPALTAVLAASALTVALASPPVTPAAATVRAPSTTAAVDPAGARAAHPPEAGSPHAGTLHAGPLDRAALPWRAPATTGSPAPRQRTPGAPGSPGAAGSPAPEDRTPPPSRWRQTLLEVADGLRPPPAPHRVSPAAREVPDEHRPPVDHAVVVARFRAPPQPWSPGHRGVDLAVGVGVPVVATAPGVVTFSGTVVNRGVITVTHADGLRTSLEPVAGTVAAGTVVAAGDVLGTVHAGASHCRPVCLHWGVRQGATYVDPLRLLPGPGPVVLLPDR